MNRFSQQSNKKWVKSNLVLKKLVLILVLLSTSLYFLEAQSNNFLNLSSQPTNLSQEQLNFISNISSQTITKEIQYVTHGQIDDFLSNLGELNLSVPGFNTSISSDQVKYKVTDSSNYTYMGKITSESGYIGLSIHKGYLAGFIHTNDYYWELIPLTKKVSILREHDKLGYSNDVCVSNTFSMPPLPDDCDDNSGCPATIDVLILQATPATVLIVMNGK